MSGSRRLFFAAVLLAIVVGATLLSFWVANRNFRMADPAKTPRTAEVLAMTNVEGDESRTMFARYFASESNRAMFVFMGVLQMIGCGGAFAFALGVARGKALRFLLASGCILSIVLAPLVQKMIRDGRALDFVSRANGAPPELKAFLRWHGAYMAADLLLLLAAIAAIVLIGAARGGAAAEERVEAAT